MKNKKLVVGVAALVAAAALVGVGVFAAFSDTESTDVGVDAGALDITGAGDISVADLAPGDIVVREITVTIPGGTNEGDLIELIRLSIPTASVTDEIGTPQDTGDTDPVGAGQSLLDGSDGLRLVLARCDGTWTLPTANAPLGTPGTGGLQSSVTCSGGAPTIVQSDTKLSELVDAPGFEFDAADFGLTPTGTGTFPEDTTLALVAQLTFPETAGNEYEQAALTFDFLFEAVQRAGINR